MRLAFGLILCTLSNLLLAQPAANSWINYSQDYFQIKIAEDGVYRLDFSALSNANVPINSIDPRNFQLFSMGAEIPLYVEGEADGTFDVLDYIEFYAKKNRGELDSVIYKGKANQPNPYYSLFSDTSSYYLTWNSSLNNKRYSPETAIDFGNYFAATYLWKERVYTYPNLYYGGETFTANATDPDYPPTEGWFDQPVSLGQTKTYNLDFNNRLSSGPFITMNIAYVGASDWSGQSTGDHHVRIEFGNETADDIFEGYELRKQSFNFSPTQVVGGPNNLLYRSINDIGSAVDRTALAYIQYEYPHSMVLDNASYFEFSIDDNSSQNKQFVELINFTGGNAPILYDLSNQKRIRVIQTLNSYRMLIPNGSGRKECVILNSNQVKTAQLIAISPNNKMVDYKSLAPDSAYLMLYHPLILPEVTRYAAFRTSTGHRPLLVDIEQLYHQFAYGISKNPLAIRNFIDYSLNNFNTAPQFLYLMGKSVNQYTARKDNEANALNLVPSYGNPTTDNLLSAGLNQSYPTQAAIATGRISANNNNELGIYLDKVIEFENASPALWMKDVLHFAGGLSLGETNRFTGYLNSYRNILEGPPFGGSAQLFRKSTSVPIQTTLSDSIRNLINRGVSLMTFFGHAAATGGFDISIDSPDKLNNRGKYPVLLANSCFSGNYHQAGIRSVAEQYVLEPNKGAIAFIASGSLGFASSLNIYSNALYQNMTRELYGRPLSECMAKTVADIEQNNPLIDLRFVSLEMSLQGDPALRLNPMDLPDYKLSLDQLSTSPSALNTEIDSFEVKINIRNIGRASYDTILVQLTRKFPQGMKSDTNYLRLVPNLFYQRPLSIKLPIDRINGVGQNEFTLLIDPNNSIPELDELNNRLDFDLLIRSGDLVPVYPYDYSIVGEQGIELRASTAFALEKELLYQFELDTNLSFSSPFLNQTTMLSTGGILEWSPPELQSMSDSTVYYWRVSRVPAAGQMANWRTSSFQYIPNETGWAQAHFDQFKANESLFLEANSSTRQFEYVDNVKELFIQNIGMPTLAQYNDIRYAVDADTRERNACGGTPGFLIAVLDSLNLDSWETPYGGLNGNRYYGQANSDNYCAPNRLRPEKYFLFRQTDTSQLFAMRDFLNQEIPAGNYIVAYSWLSVDYSGIWDIDSSILAAFNQQGSLLINQISNGVPFIFTAQKGDFSSVQEVMGTSTSDIIELRRTLTVSADFGTLFSPAIPYSPNWKSIAYRIQTLESNSQDQVELKISGIKSNGSEVNVQNFNAFYQDTSLSNQVNTNAYQNLKLSLESSDLSAQTAPQVTWWQIRAEELPDAAMAPNLFFQTNSDTLNEGEVFEFEMGVKNISQRDMDSLLVAFKVLTAQNQVMNVPFPRQAALLADSLMRVKLELPTRGLRGNNTLIMELNPNGDQAEQHQFNNLAQHDFVVLGDRLNPLIDVTIDGRHILNRELVSAKPEIAIQLQDDNRYLALDDTSAFSIFLRYPNGQEELMNFGGNQNAQLEFIPASLPENKAMARLRPNLTADGVYRLRVQAFDKSGNSSGKQDYSLEFEVMNRSSITRLVNYPNPFSTSTRFVFTLTGSEIPDQMQIQIMTITGKVVREIDQFEIGPIHIGNNITQFAWDGRDEFGDQLANGVYLYRVKAKIRGSNIDHRDSNSDQFFVKDFGKMYLLR